MWTRTRGALTEPLYGRVENCPARLGGPGISKPAGDDGKARGTEEMHGRRQAEQGKDCRAAV